MILRSYKELIVWQRSMELLVEVYRATGKYPPEERFGLAVHTRKSAVSIPSNVAEGYTRGHRTEYLRHVSISYASGAELETQLIAADLLGFIKPTDRRAFELRDQVERMLGAL